MSAQTKLHCAPSGLAVARFLTSEGLDELPRFKYVAGPYTILDNVLNPWWLFVAKFVPTWVSPNLVTLTGLLFTLLSLFCTVLVCSGDPSRYVEGSLVFLVVAISMFLYQTLDAVDGKHARNTGQATPLGALFDHGCDAVAATAGVVFLELCSSTPGSEQEELRTIAGVIAFVLPPISFFAAQWEHLYTHEMPAGGVTEAQFLGIGTMLIAAMWGPSLFQADASTMLPGPIAAALGGLIGGSQGILLKRAMQAATTLFALVLIAGSVSRCLRHSSFKCLPSLLPVVLLLLFTCILYMGTTGMFIEHRLLSLSSSGLVMIDLNIRMIIAAVCRFEFPMMPVTMVPFGITCLAGIVLPALSVQPEAGKHLHLILMITTCCWQLFSILRLVTDTISRVCVRLDIPFLAALDKTKDK